MYSIYLKKHGNMPDNNITILFCPIISLLQFDSKPKRELHSFCNLFQ